MTGVGALDVFAVTTTLLILKGLFAVELAAFFLHIMILTANVDPLLTTIADAGVNVVTDVVLAAIFTSLVYPVPVGNVAFVLLVVLEAAEPVNGIKVIPSVE